MAGITVTASDLETVTGIGLSEDKFAALDRIVRPLIRVVFRGDIDSAAGRTADVLNSVYTSAAVRLMTNPSGARVLGLGSANVTYGGSDEDVADAFSLTARERSDLATLRGARPSYIILRTRPVYPEV